MASKRELLDNGLHWIRQAKDNGLTQKKIGAVFIFWDENDPEGSAIAVSSHPDKAVLRRQLNVILGKSERLIVTPEEAARGY